MPTIPEKVTLTTNTAAILNAIRNNASINYQSNIPVATENVESIRTIGSVLTTMPSVKNEFISVLINRIARVYVTSRSYENPWAFWKKGVVDFGETIEEIFVNLSKPHEYDVQRAESEVFKREIPDVRASFHIMNYQKFYKDTIENNELKLAFMSYEGVTDLIARIVERLYTSMNYDEFLTMKYLLAVRLLEGLVNVTAVTAPTNAQGYKDIISEVKGVSNKMEFLSTKYNLAGVYNHTNKDDQFLIINAAFDAKVGVEVVAEAFNMSKVEFMGHRVLVDSFGDLDTDRLNELFAEDENYTPLTDAQLVALDSIPCVLVDRDFFMIFDNLLEFTEIYNGQGMYWNYFLHAWKTFSVSMFANNMAFVYGEPTVTSVTVTPTALSISAGQTAELGVTVVTTNFASKAVNWTSDNTGVTVDGSGTITVAPDATGKANIKATSVFDSTKSGTCVVTIS